MFGGVREWRQWKGRHTGWLRLCQVQGAMPTGVLGVPLDPHDELATQPLAMHISMHSMIAGLHTCMLQEAGNKHWAGASCAPCNNPTGQLTRVRFPARRSPSAAAVVWATVIPMQALCTEYATPTRTQKCARILHMRDVVCVTLRAGEWRQVDAKLVWCACIRISVQCLSTLCLPIVAVNPLM